MRALIQYGSTSELRGRLTSQRRKRSLGFTPNSIKTNPRVRFMIAGRPYKMKVGEAYEFNNQKTHSVMNKGKEDRITFIFDYV
ncbi:MAG: aspartyl/asparaginyl beta-hydroxylase domain-containing protein, partial [Gammaproteobacteria bacterium]|nr:aspartyl/asparaginyl beta-hydroxylase domain-containing protein [Gammaproteobacteria bacterium]